MRVSLGGTGFVERVLRGAGEVSSGAKGVNPKRLLEKVADLKSGSKVPAVVKARAVPCYVGVRKPGIASVSVVRELGSARQQ